MSAISLPEILAQSRAASSQSELPLGELAKRLTHNIRNPLSVITAAASQLLVTEETLFSNDDLALVKAILESADRLERILSRFTVYAAPDPAEFEKINLNELCRAEVAHCRADLPAENDIKAVAFHFEDDRLEIDCDQVLIRTLLCNIIRNSFQSLGTNGQLHIHTRRDGDYARLEFVDSGHGIAPRIFDQAFTPFTTSRPGNTGLGLAIAEKIVRLHNGSISIAPNDKSGTTVRVALPFPAADDIEE